MTNAEDYVTLKKMIGVGNRKAPEMTEYTKRSGRHNG